jgi:N-acetylglucosamine kinase-like BadF-type ATPase
VIRVLGVDGGQSGIRVGYSDGREPVELEGASHMEGDTLATVSDATIEGWRALGSPQTDRAVLGLTTVPASTAERQRLCHLVGTATHAASVWLTDDAVTAHAGALSMGWGVSVTAGTGVACVALPRDGTPRVIGGHGFLLGDEGGGYWIGREGLRAALRAHDGRGPATELEETAGRRFEGLNDLGPRIHRAPRAVDAIARFAPDVLAAAADDVVADEIVERATRELLTLISTAVSAVRSQGEPVPVALGGRLLDGGVLHERVLAAIGRGLPDVAPRRSDASPLAGALLLGAATDPGAWAPLVTDWVASA